MRVIDFSKPLDEDETAYVRQREWLIRDAELAGFEVRLFDDDSVEEESENPEEEHEDEVDYNDLTVEQLHDEINARNEERDEDDQIEVAKSAKKAELIAALEADDAEEEEAE